MEEDESFLNYNFEKYLADRYFYDNLENDFSSKNDFLVKRNELNYEHYFLTLNSEIYEFYKSFDFISKTEYSRIVLEHQYNGICSEENNNVLILPFFYSIQFYGKFNVFIGSMRSKENLDEIIYDLYYFDTKGRFIKKERGFLPNLVPNIAVINNEVIEININQFGVYEVYDYNLLKVSHHESGEQYAKYQLIDNNGIFILDKNYFEIVKMKSSETIFALDKNEIFCFDMKGNKINSYPFNKIEEVNDAYIKVSYHFKNEKIKYTVINSDGTLALQKTYDFIEKCNMSNHYIFFEGELERNFDDCDTQVVQKKIDKSFEDMYDTDILVYGSYTKGKWGLIGKDEKIIIPCNYEWIEELSEDVFLINEGGRLYNCSRCIDSWNLERVDELIIYKGKWSVFEVSNSKILPIMLENIYKDYNNHSKNYAYKIE